MPGPVAERRVCSVLFCDLVGFTPLSEAHDAEEIRELLSRYFDVARTVIGRYGGTVEKFIGDAVMAVWGTPVATEGDTERAVRAALDLVDTVAALGVDQGVPTLAARAGVVTGEVAVTIGATHEGMVAGDAVNTAARVQSTAPPKAVYVDDTTRRLAQAAVAFDDAGEHELKGKTEPQRLWRAVRVLSGVGGSQRVDGLEAPLIGRDVEVRLVRDLFHATVDRRQPRLLVMSGAAGVGKSRVGWEFEKYVDGLAGTVLWHRGRCLSYGDGVSFWAFAEIVRQRLLIAEEDPIAVAAQKLAHGVDAVLSDPTERGYVGIRLGRLLGVPFEGDTGQEIVQDELFAGWRLFLERLAAVDPVVLLIEDMQHADSGLLDFIDHLIGWARDVPIYVLALTRPELDEHRPGYGTGRNRSTLTLDPLDAASMDELLGALVPDMPSEAKASIAAHAQGVPLFAVETIRSLVDRDIVVPREGRYQLVAELGELAVPDSLHGLLAARLDALDPTVRALVADAAVVGTTFPAEALLAVSGQPETVVRAGLDELLRREVLEISADPLSPQRGTYRFAQQMLRQVAYDTLSRHDRKARHLAVARHLRAAFPGDGEEVIDVIARHYLDGLAAVSGDSDEAEIRELAANSLTRAGDRGRRTGAQQRAAASYAEAASLYEVAGDEESERRAAVLWEQASEASELHGEWLKAVEFAGRARILYERHGQTRDAARVRGIGGSAMASMGRLAEARTEARAALEVLREDPDADTVRMIMKVAGHEIFGGNPEGDALAAEAVGLAQALDVEPTLLTYTFIVRGLGHNFVGRFAEATAYYREASLLAETAGAGGLRGLALVNLSSVLLATDPVGAAAAASSAAESCRRVGAHGRLAFAVINEVVACLQIGEWAKGHDLLDRAANEDGLGDHEDVQLHKAWLLSLQGDTATAAALLGNLPAKSISDDPQDQALVATVHTMLAAAEKDLGGCLRHAKTAMSQVGTLTVRHEGFYWPWAEAAHAAHQLRDDAVIQELVDLVTDRPAGELGPLLSAERDLAVARRSALSGDQTAPAALRAAVESLRAAGSPYHLAQGQLDLAEQLMAVNQDPTEAIDDAIAIAKRLGASPVLDRATSMQSAAATSV
jgi:class 3 adenylate cyclase/tetratricopeptide (TPR) repeat protein